MANGLLAFGTGLMIVAAAISAILATYFIRKNSYKNAEAAGIFGGIFAFAALIFFFYLQFTENEEINRLKKALSVVPGAAKQAFYEEYYDNPFKPSPRAVPAVVPAAVPVAVPAAVPVAVPAAQ